MNDERQAGCAVVQYGGSRGEPTRSYVPPDPHQRAGRSRVPRRVRGGKSRSVVAGRQFGALTNSLHHLLQIGADQVAALVQLSGIPFRVIAPKV